MSIYDFKVKAQDSSEVSLSDYKDERDLIVTITDSGEALKEKAVTIPQRLGSCIDMEPQKAGALYELLYELIGKLTDPKNDGLQK